MTLVEFGAGLVACVAIGWVAWQLYRHSRYDRQINELRTQRDLANQRSQQLEAQLAQAQLQAQELNDQFRSESVAHATTSARLQESQKTVRETEQRFTDTFKALANDALKSNNKAFIELANQTLQALINKAKGDIGKQQEQIDALVKPLKESLSHYQIQTQQMEKDRAQQYGELRENILKVSQQAHSLETALRQPQARGQWGELTLKRVFEFAGLTENIHYSLQVSVQGDQQQRLRPDAVVHMPGDYQIIIDAKTPLTAYQEAVTATDADTREKAIQRHVQAVRDHIKDLSSKSYFDQFAKSPPFVVLFLPGDCFFMAALQADISIVEFASQKKVILAGPSTLIPLLLTVAFAWQQEKLAQNAEEISQRGKELYDRMRVLAEHLNNIGKAVNKTVEAWNDAAGSLERRVLPAARRFKELGAGTAEQIPILQQIHTSAGTVPQLEEQAPDQQPDQPPDQPPDSK